MVMRSIYLILGCCLMFAAVMVIGVSMQSCKSKRGLEKRMQVDSMGMSAYKEELDSFAFRRLLEYYNKNFTLEIRHYHPVKDSTFEVTDTYLDTWISLKSNHSHQRDSSGFDSMQLVKEDSTMTDVSEETEEKEEEPALAKENKIIFYLVLVYLLYLWIEK